jgi:hypothetical protein
MELNVLVGGSSTAIRFCRAKTVAGNRALSKYFVWAASSEKTRRLRTDANVLRRVTRRKSDNPEMQLFGVGGLLNELSRHAWIASTACHGPNRWTSAIVRTRFARSTTH